MKAIILTLLMSGSLAYGEDMTCSVKGMHCKGCTEMVEGKLCDESKYSTCTVKVTDAKKKAGKIRLVTKAKDAKVNQTEVGKIIEDAGYKMENCSATVM